MAPSASETIARVKVAVDQLVQALGRGDATGLLTSETTLAASTLALARVDPAALPAERERVRDLIRDTYLSIAQCRRHGAVVAELAALVSQANAYGRDGHHVTPVGHAQVSLRS